MEVNLQSMLEAIKSSDVVESRIQLLRELVALDLLEKSDVASLFQCLTRLWEDFTCLDVSQCMLNKSVLRVAKKYLDSDVSGCLEVFLDLGTKASQWCAKHLKMPLMSKEESQEEEHASIFFQLLLDSFRFSVSSFSAITKYYSMGEKTSLVMVQNFVSAQLNLAKEVISDAKRVDSFGTEILKSAQVLIDSVVCLCKESGEAVNWEVSCIGTEENRENISSEEASTTDHVINITALTVGTLSELGILAAKDGGSLVAILNTSWKGVITLLQLGKQALASKVKVANVILKLTSLINESLRCVADAWSSSSKEITATEARRAFLPVKFYLINTVKLTLLFPDQACLVYKDVSLCVLMISKLRFSLSQQSVFKPASEVMTDLLEKISVDLLNAVLNSKEVKCELKHELLNWLFTDDNITNVTCKDQRISSRATSLGEIFSVNYEALPGARTLSVDRVALFLSLLKYSLDLEDDAKIAIAKKLSWVLSILTHEEVYAYVLSSQLPSSVHGSGKSVEFRWDQMFSALVLALKMFMIVVSSSLAWEELGLFLIENFLHPHFLCWEIVMELWSFLLRYAEVELVNGSMEKLCSILKSLAFPESVLDPCSALRKMARSVCMLLNHDKQTMVDWVYNSVFADSRTQLSSDVGLALLLEGFPVNLLSGTVRNHAKRKIVSDYINFLDSCDGKLTNDSQVGVFGAPVFAFSACLRTLEITGTEVDKRTLEILATVIRNYGSTVDKATKEKYRDLVSELLAIISNIDHLYASKEMDNIIFELQKLFISSRPASDNHLYKCKPSLALFMAGLSHIDMSESDDCAKSCAVWDLYHMLLRERHWSLVHLAVTAFGYFCARTSCNQLWRFVPQDAALCYDPASGSASSTERFMSELKAFLEKERALIQINCPEQLELLQKEGTRLQEMVLKNSSISFETEECENMDIGLEKQPSKRRKLPEGICEGVKLLQSGLKAIEDGLSKWQPNHLEGLELQEKFSSQFSCIENMIGRLVGLTHPHQG